MIHHSTLLVAIFALTLAVAIIQDASAIELDNMKVERCLLKAYPAGPLSGNHFEFTTKELSLNHLPEDAIAIQLKHISVDPYMRTRFQPGMGYIMPGFEIGKPISSGCVAEVIQSKNDKYPVGSLVSGLMPWETVQILENPTLDILPQLEGIPPSYYLGVLGLTGLSAYFPFKYYSKHFLLQAKKKANDKKPVVFVSGCAGAVGSVFAQLCKSIGCTVYGSAGSEEKITLCKSQFGCDDAFNYKDGIAAGLDAVLQQDQTIDLYFDNVGGEMLDEVLLRMTRGGKIICCGSISDYDKKKEDKYRLKNYFCITTQHLQMQGFLMGHWMDEIPEARKELSSTLKDGTIRPYDTELHGFGKVTEGLMALFKGGNIGKLVISL